MKKILFTATIESHIRQFHQPYLEYFKDKGWDVHVACKGKFDCKYVDKFIEIPFQRSPFKLKNLNAYKKLKKVIDENNYDIIHCHTPMGAVLTRFASKKARKMGAKIIYTAHGFHFYKGSPILNWIIYYPVEKYLSRCTDCLITINNEDYNCAKLKFKAEKTEFVHGVGVDTYRFKPINSEEKSLLRHKYGYEENDFLLIFAAEFIKRKNHQLLINVISLLKNEIPKIRLLLAGTGTETMSYCKQIVHNLDIDKMVDFLGYRNDLEKIMPICDIAVTSSIQEGLPVNVMEAMACGLPIVASKIRGHIDLIEHRKGGFLCSLNDKDEFCNAIREIYGNPELSKKMGKTNINTVKKFDNEIVKKEMSYIYENKSFTYSQF